MPEKKPKLIVIVGPTASGKTGLSVELAKRLGSEVISADSRQVYKGFDLGSGKVTKKEMQDVPHHCLDICSPRYTCTVELWRRHAEAALTGIGHRTKKGTKSLKSKKRDLVPFLTEGEFEKVPIVVGGTGFYIDALVYGLNFPAVLPNVSLRKVLRGLSPEELLARLKELDPDRAASVEQKNPRRLMRAIEIATALGRVPTLSCRTPKYDVTWIGLNPSREVLAQKIAERLHVRLKQGLAAEVRHLHEGTHQASLSWKRLESFGLEYRYVAEYVQGKITREVMCELIVRDSVRYARRQMTWFKRNQEIEWHESAEQALREWVVPSDT